MLKAFLTALQYARRVLGTYVLPSKTANSLAGFIVFLFIPAFLARVNLEASWQKQLPVASIRYDESALYC